jgi:Tfp pilus assembly protein PilZ
MHPTDPERRHASRHAVTLDAQYDSVAIAMQGRVTSLSNSGLFVQSDFLDDPGTMVALSLQFSPSAQPLTIAGRVAHVVARGPNSGMGIQFTDLSRKSRQRLARYIEVDRSERASSVASTN